MYALSSFNPFSKRIQFLVITLSLVWLRNKSANLFIFSVLISFFNFYTLIALLEKIADLVNDKKLEGISDLRDESDRDGIRVVVELKRDAVPALVQNNLFKKTSLQWAFSGEEVVLYSLLLFVLVFLFLF